MDIKNIPNEKRSMMFLVKQIGSEFVVETELAESGAFAYGNGTCVHLYIDNEHVITFDTRYLDACYTVEGYRSYFTDWVNAHWSNAVSVEEIDKIN